MSSVAVALPRPKFNFGELLKVVGLPTDRERARGVVDQTNDLIREIVSVVDGLVATTMDQRSSADFVKVRGEAFPHYRDAILALGKLARIVLPKQTIERLSVESFSEMEADFRDLGASTVGADLTERGLFTVWTLRKIYDLAKEIETSAPKDVSPEEAEKAKDFVDFALWNRFHVDCIIKSMRASKPVYPEVAEHLRDGLRAAVNAYAHIRQWVDMRNPIEEPVLGPVSWTLDDEILLADSMRDLNLESA